MMAVAAAPEEMAPVALKLPALLSLMTQVTGRGSVEAASSCLPSAAVSLDSHELALLCQLQLFFSSAPC